MDVGEVDAVFEVGPVPADLAALALAAGAPPGLLERMWALRYPRPRIEFAFRGAPFPTMAMWEAELDQRERLSDGLVVREATWDDDARLSDLFADSAERLGAWDVTVERSPNPYAQARLQENAHTKLVVDRGVALAVSTQAGRNSLVGGERLSVAWMGGWRVRNGFRRHGFSTMLMNTPGPAASRFGALTYWYVRLENGTANSWIASAVRPIDESGRAFEKRTATVYHLDPAAGRRDPRVRLIRPDDVDRCVELINTTHAGLDLFRPYSPSWFEERLYDLLWGPRPPFVANVYGWDDMAVLVDGGRIVACAGLWDKGRDVRERWRHRESGEERVVDTACLMDVGCEPGHEAELAALVRHHLATTRDLGRASLTAAFEFVPAILDHLADAAPRPETRSLETMGFTSDEFRVDATVTRPYTDLAYW